MPDPVLTPRSASTGLPLPHRLGPISLADAGMASRFLYRGPPGILGESFGVALPAQPLRSARNGRRAALWLGPDEWRPIAEGETDSRHIRLALADVVKGKAAAVFDISHQYADILVEGPNAANLINAGCPLDLDLSSFAVGMVARTVFAKAEIVLRRTAATVFRVEMTRSYAQYVVGVLIQSAGEVD